MKVLIFHPALAPYRVDFFNALNKFFNTSFYFSLNNVKDQKFDQEKLKELCDFNCNYISNGFEFFGRSIRFRIFNIIRKEKPDIIFCSEYSQITLLALIFCKFWNRNIKLYTFSDDSISNSKSRKGYRSVFRNLISRRLNGVVFTSKQVSSWYSENISTETHTLELPVIHSEESLRKKYLESINQANRNISKYELNGKKVLLFVGRLVDVKNLFFLIKCFSNVESNDKRLIIVGDGPLKDKLFKYTEALDLLDEVLFIGRKEGVELYSWYTFSQLFILPSTYEPFGAVVNEALVGGSNVLCSSLAGASALINSGNGELFNPYDEKDLIVKLNYAFRKVNVISNKVSQLRISRMPFTFEDKFFEFVRSL